MRLMLSSVNSIHLNRALAYSLVAAAMCMGLFHCSISSRTKNEVLRVRIEEKREPIAINKQLTWAGGFIAAIVTVHVSVTDPVTWYTGTAVVINTPVTIGRAGTRFLASCSSRGIRAGNPAR